MTDKLTDRARARIEDYASEHGPKPPPIPRCEFESAALATDVRAAIEGHTNAHGVPPRT